MRVSRDKYFNRIKQAHCKVARSNKQRMTYIGYIRSFGRVNSAGAFCIGGPPKGYEKSINSLAIFSFDAILGEYGGTEDDY